MAANSRIDWSKKSIASYNSQLNLQDDIAFFVREHSGLLASSISTAILPNSPPSDDVLGFKRLIRVANAEYLDDLSLNAVIFSLKFSDLCHLQFFNIFLTMSQLRTLSTLCKETQLAAISFDYVIFERNASSDINDALVECICLDSVSLASFRGSRLGDAFVACLCSKYFSQPRYLQWLDLTSCQITDTGCMSLLHMIENNTTLRGLSLACNDLTNDSISFLVRCLTSAPTCAGSSPVRSRPSSSSRNLNRESSTLSVPSNSTTFLYELPRLEWINNMNRLIVNKNKESAENNKARVKKKLLPLPYSDIPSISDNCFVLDCENASMFGSMLYRKADNSGSQLKWFSANRSLRVLDLRDNSMISITPNTVAFELLDQLPVLWNSSRPSSTDTSLKLGIPGINSCDNESYESNDTMNELTVHEQVASQLVDKLASLPISFLI